MNSTLSKSQRVIIIGGGAAALETMLALRAIAGELAEIELYAPRDDFVVRPLAVTEAFGDAELLKFDLRELTSDCGATFVEKSVVSVETADQHVILQGGGTSSYDYLVVATGTKSLWVVPGAKTFWGPGVRESIGEVLEAVEEKRSGRTILTMPDRAGWPLPIYELALHLAAEIDKSGDRDASIAIVSPEQAPLEIFGERAGRIVLKLLEDNQIEFIPETVPLSWADGQLTTRAPGSIVADTVITLPQLTGRRVGGLPFNAEGFLPTDDSGLIHGLTREYAAGDVTASPVKFGGFATAHADVVASSIAHKAWELSAASDLSPDFRATLLTPDGPVFLGESEDWSDLDQETATEEWNPATKIRGKYLSPALLRMSR